MRQSLPGITRIAYCDCSLLPPDIMLRALSGVPVGVYTTVQDILLDGAATCEVETQFANNSQVQKATLSFQTLDDVPTHRHIAFVIFTANKECYIIGTKEQPYPTIKITRSTGTPSGEPSVRKYEVAFSSKVALALCAV